MKRPLHLYMILSLVFFLFMENISCAEEKAPFFDLPQWGTENRFSLDDFKGKIVVLDFFSASCGVCFRASWEIGIEIQDFYAARSGNPHGIPVKVVAINSDTTSLDDMKAFLEDTELDLVLDDSAGNILKQYGGTTTPYIVVIDATGTAPYSIVPRIIYRQAVYDGVDKLRKTIDSITGRTEQKESASGITVERTQHEDKPVTHETTLDNAALIASDLFVTDTQIEYLQKRPSNEFSVSLSHRYIDVDYVTEYIGVRRDKNLTAEYISLQGSAGFDVNDTITLTAGGGFYDGFQTYRALWLDQYYQHAFDVLSGYIDNLDGYKKAHPRGYNVSSSLRWEYLPDNGFIEAGISYQHDIVSPGYIIGEEIVRLRDAYDTISGHLAFENVLTRRMRTLAECRIDNITDRDLRFTLQGAINYAISEHLVLRLAIAGAKENPDFTSKSISAVIEHDWHDKWFMSIFGRYYDDTSEIANAIVRNAVAPPIETCQAGLGLRLQGHSTSFKLVMGPSYSRYQKDPERDRSFDQLYKDRDWLSVQIAFMHQF